MPFSRVLIANRGEIAVRITRACRELGISPLAVYSTADASALHTRLADAAIAIGPPPAPQSYLHIPTLIAAAQAGGAEAVHPGYGFLSENADFAQACADAGLVFIGPPPAAIRAMGGKIGARQLARAADVPVVPGYDGADQSDNALAAAAATIGYPLLIKASAGGGGKGMRVVEQAEAFAAALEGARREARAAFGDDTVLIEKLIIQPRHVEIQVLADTHGNVVHLGERECSIQRRHQKIVEEAPSPALSPELRAAMGAAAVRIARAAGYVNAGTVEFVLDPAGNYYFLEMNTRLQVEHPITELVTGLDLVHLQLQIAAGAPLPFTQEDIHLRGSAIEVRLYAEDPQTYLPATGRLALLEPPGGPGVRVDSGLVTGDEVAVHYDPLIAKLIVFGADRAAAVMRLQRALADYVVLGTTTNLPLLRALAAHPAFAAGATHTGFLTEHPLTVAPPSELPPAVLAAAAVWELSNTPARPLTPDPFAALWRTAGLGVPLAYRWGEHDYQLTASAAGAGWRITLNGRDLLATALAVTGDELVLAFSDPALPASDGAAPAARERFRLARNGADLFVAWQGHAYRLTHPAPLSADVVERQSQGAESLIAPMPGTVIKLLVSAGETVAEGQPLMVLEAMKMEHTLVAPHAGLVRRLPFGVGASVTGGVPLIELVEAGPAATDEAG